ncbi:unnamed protein product [Darwinula stevensoni]|uniref:MAM domain-containing protein n=1 Tax=Darwinula stevensoni TaxID=69355 RepID=A0A7R9A833_9CRUS|nr:unnamed protein product [Darwinula stevensoni]CAG0894930.1 unnamed protein product [Darwinula stevensoni]
MMEPFIDANGPNLGSLKVMMKTMSNVNGQEDVVDTIWRLNNHQGQNWLYAQVPIVVPNLLDEIQRADAIHAAAGSHFRAMLLLVYRVGKGGRGTLGFIFEKWLLEEEMAPRGGDGSSRRRWLLLPRFSPFSSCRCVVFEGMWGSSRAGAGYIAIDDIAFYDATCNSSFLLRFRSGNIAMLIACFTDTFCLVVPALPEQAKMMKGNCYFDRNLCGYRTTSDSNIPSDNWQLALGTRKPPRAPNDHTFDSPDGGYAYFDIYVSNQRRTSLISPVMERVENAGSDGCLSFWFKPLGTGDSTTLRVKQLLGNALEDTTNNINGNNRPNPANTTQPLWEIQTFQLDNQDWQYGQVPIKIDQRFRILFEGLATKGGFALDDITIYTTGYCLNRPSISQPGTVRTNQG